MYGIVYHWTIVNEEQSYGHLYLVNLESEENTKESVWANDLKAPIYFNESYLNTALTIFRIANVRLNFYYLINFSSTYRNKAIYLPPKQQA